MKAAKAIILILLFKLQVFAQEKIIDDSLNNQTIGVLYGGSFTKEGYKPGIGFNHILYELNQPVSRGYITFQIKGMSSDQIPDDANHGFIGMYDGRGIEEPADYATDYKNNFFRWNVHWRQNHHAIKSVVNCAAPTSERLNASRAVFINDSRDWTEEPTGKSIDWDAKKWYTVKVEWTDKNFKVFIDNQEVWSVEANYAYVPQKHRIWLGSAPGYGTKYASALESIVYRNFVLVASN